MRGRTARNTHGPRFVSLHARAAAALEEQKRLEHERSAREARHRELVALATDEERVAVEPAARRAEHEIRFADLVSSARTKLDRREYAGALADARAPAELEPAADEPGPIVLEARHLIGPEKIVVNSIGMRLAFVPAGEFLRGTDDAEKNEAPPRGCPRRRVLHWRVRGHQRPVRPCARRDLPRPAGRRGGDPVRCSGSSPPRAGFVACALALAAVSGYGAVVEFDRAPFAPGDDWPVPGSGCYGGIARRHPPSLSIVVALLRAAAFARDRSRRRRPVAH